MSFQLQHVQTGLYLGLSADVKPVLGADGIWFSATPEGLVSSSNGYLQCNETTDVTIGSVKTPWVFTDEGEIYKQVGPDMMYIHWDDDANFLRIDHLLNDKWKIGRAHV